MSCHAEEWASYVEASEDSFRGVLYDCGLWAAASADVTIEVYELYFGSVASYLCDEAADVVA